MTRAEDERLLAMLSDYARGDPMAAIAACHETTVTALNKRIARVREDDIVHDPAAAPYWHHLKQRKRKPR